MAFSEQTLLRLLEQHHINYIVRTHEPIFTVAEGEALGLPNVQAAVKSLLLTDDKRNSCTDNANLKLACCLWISA